MPVAARAKKQSRSERVAPVEDKDITLLLNWEGQKGEIDTHSRELLEETEEPALQIPGEGERLQERDSFPVSSGSYNDPAGLGTYEDESVEKWDHARLSSVPISASGAFMKRRGDDALQEASRDDISRKTREGRDRLEDVNLEDPDEVFMLKVGIPEPTLSLSTFNVEVVDDAGRIVWSGEDVEMPEMGEEIAFSFRGSMFKDGIYSLKIYEIVPDSGKVVSEYGYTFRVLFSERP